MTDALDDTSEMIEGRIAAALGHLPVGDNRRDLAMLFDELLTTMKNDRQRLREQIFSARHNALYRNLCEANPQLTWTADPAGNHDYYNAQWLKYTGTSMSDNAGRGWLKFIHPDEREECSSNWELAVRGGKNFEMEVRLRRADGQYRWQRVQGVAIRDEEGAVEHWYGWYTDIEVQRRLMSELISARDQAHMASKLKSEFVANMSHELRTPMNGVLGMVEVLLRSDLNPKAREYSLMIREAGRSLLSIINDILDFSKIEAGKLELSSCDFDVTKVMEGVGEILGPVAEEKDLELVTYIDPDIPASLIGDPLRIRQVLINLGGNAVKFTDKGTITFRADKIDCQSNCIRIKFSIADTGIGIPEEQKQSLFEPFTQADGSIGRKYGGTGLGLSISKQLVELMGGELELENQVAGGSVFSFNVLFPYENLQPSHVPHMVRGSTVMLVGLRPPTAKCIKEYATRYGVTVTICEKFESALETLKMMGSNPTSLVVEAGDNKEKCMEFGKKARAIAASGLKTIYITKHARLASFEDSINKWNEKCLTRPLRVLDMLGCLGAGPNSAEEASLQTQEVEVLRILPQPVLTRESKASSILVVDDNKINQQVARLLLNDMGLAVQVVDNGIEAVNAIKKKHFDLIFLDCQMPEIDGYEACQIIKQIQHRRGVTIPVIAMTANAMTGSREQCLAAGMDDYVCKPIDPTHLEKMVKHWLEIKEKGKTGPPLSLFVETEKEISIPPDNALDIDQLKKKFNGKVIRQLLTMFVESANDEVAKMEDDLRSAAYRDVAAKAHAFRGACGTICATRLQNCCKEMELATDSADKKYCEDLFGRLKKTLKTTLQEIDELLVEPELNKA